MNNFPEVPEADDEINHPKHYTGVNASIECVYFKEQLPACRSDAFKYVWRAGDKKDVPVEKDLGKALWYLDRIIANGEPFQPKNVGELTLALSLFKAGFVGWKYDILRNIILGDIRGARAGVVMRMPLLQV